MKVIISGYGKMGHMIEKELKARGIELTEASEDITATRPDVARECVCIDFTTPAAIRANYKFIAQNFKAAVIGTTGWHDIEADVKKAFQDAGTPMIYASNFSLGVNALEAAVKKVGQMLRGSGYTPSIEEIHHIHKLDAPSGTAITIGRIIEESLGEKPVITSVREGEVPGIHTVTLDSSVDKITLRHEAYSREGLAKGAVVAALMTEGLKGVHEFSELL